MSDNQTIFLENVKKENKKHRKNQLLIFAGLIVFILGIIIVNTKVIAQNKNEITHVKEDVRLVKLDYVDVLMFNQLLSTYDLQYEILLKLDRDEIETVDEVRVWFDDLRREILFGIKVPSRTNSGSGSPGASQK